MRRKEKKVLGGMAVEYCGKRKMSKRPNYFLVFVFMVVLCGWLQGATYYISADGDDGNSGVSPEQAWRSIEKVNGTVFSPGDKILFKGGKTFSGGIIFRTGGTAEEPIIVSSYGDGRATISSGDEKGFYGRDCGGIEVKDLIFVGSADEGLERWEHHGINFRHNDGGEYERHVYIDNVDVSGYMFGISVGCAVENNTGYKDVRITRAEVHDNWDKGIFIYGYFPRPAGIWANSDVYIGDCSVHHNSGITVHPDPLLCGNGIELENVSGGVVEYCQSYTNGRLCNSRENGPIGVWMWESDNVTVQLCESYSNDTALKNGCGFSIGGGGSNCVLQYNYSHYNAGAGILLWSFTGGYNEVKNNVVRYNISENDGLKNNYGAITIASDRGIYNTQIYNNVLYVGAWSTGECIGIWTANIYNTSLYNNIFMTVPAKKLLKCFFATGGWNLQGNCYWSSGSELNIDWGGRVYKSLAEFRSGTGQEMLGGMAVGFEADPQLVNPGQGGTIGDPHKLNGLTAYKLQATSPLIDRGLDIHELFGIVPGGRDFYGTTIPEGTGYDVGAYEYTEAVVVQAPQGLEFKDRRAVFEEAKCSGYKLVSPLPFTVVREDSIRLKVEPMAGVAEPDKVLFEIWHLGQAKRREYATDEDFSYELDCGNLEDGRIFVKAKVWCEGKSIVIGEDWGDKGIEILLDRDRGHKGLSYRCEYIKRGDEASVLLDKLTRQDFHGNNNQISFCGCWNEDYLHLALWVKDKYINITPLLFSGEAIWDYSRMLWFTDGIEICLDTKADKSEWRRLDDFELVINATGEYRGNYWDDKEQKFLRWGEGVGIKTEYNGTINDNKDVDDGYYLLISIPWKELGISVRGGQRLGFDVQCYDRDLEAGEPFYAGWSGEGIGNTDNPSEWCNLVLSPKPYSVAYILVLLMAAITGPAVFVALKRVRQDKIIAGEAAIIEEGTTAEEPKGNGLGDAIKSFIEENYKDPDLSREAIAEYFNLSKDHVTHLFKREVGVRLTDYINEIRVFHAKELLKDRRLNISQVAFSVGYNTLQNFNKAFKKITGRTPSKYRSSP